MEDIRQMSDVTKFLSAACVATGLAVTGGSVQAEVLTNGGFDVVGTTVPNVGLVNGNTFASMPGQTGTNSWDVFASIPGWTSLAGTAGIEVQTLNTITGTNAITPHSGDYYVELDSHGGATTNSGMYQSVSLSAGLYLLEFYYSPRVSGNPGDTNRIDFGLATNYASAGVQAGPFSSFVSGPSAVPPATSVGSWTLISAMFDVTGGNYDLWFEATGKDDSLGGFIDSVSLSVVPLPLGIILLPFGVAAMHLVGRRLRAA